MRMRLAFHGLLAGLCSLTLVAQTPNEPPSHNADRDLAKLLAEKRYLEMGAALEQVHTHQTTDYGFYAGVLANRRNRLHESLRLLEPLFGKPATLLTPEQRRVGLRTMADNCFKLFRYGDAADAYTRLLDELAPTASEQERNQVRGSLRLVELLRAAPAQTLRMESAFIVPTKRNAVGLIEAPVQIGGRMERWALDTGANISTLTRSRATRLGLTLSTGTAPVVGLGGRRVQCHVAVIPELRIGRAEFHHVATLVIDDKEFYIPEVKFQMEALLGYPVLAALGRISFYADGHFGANPGSGSADAQGAPLLLEELTPLVAAGTSKGPRLFTFDTGAANTFLTAPYWREHREEFAGLEEGKLEIGGSGGTQTIPSYTAAHVTLLFGRTPISIDDVSVLKEPRPGGREYFYGNLGQDAMRKLRNFTLDFRAMRLSVDNTGQR
jgi:predicted aspartyl protease